MGKQINFIFNSDTSCDKIERNEELNKEAFHVGLATFNTILSPAFADQYGTTYRFFERSNPYSFVKLRNEDELKRIEKDDTKHQSGYYKDEIAKMKKILDKNKSPRLKNKDIEKMKALGFIPVYNGFKIRMFKRLHVAEWHDEPYVHSPETESLIYNNAHAKNSFGNPETRRDALFAFAGGIVAFLLALTIFLPIITGLGAQIG